MVITAAYLVAFVLSAVKGKWGYVLGGNGEMYSKALAEAWAKSRNKPKSWIGTKRAYFIEACRHWFGHYVADCSGLLIAAFRSKQKTYQDQKADTLYSRCKQKGAIKTIPEMPGLCVWKKGHIGVYVGNGEVAESRGRKYGVVITKLSKRPWTNWGKLADVDYSEEAIDGMKLKKGDNGELVAAYQQMMFDIGRGGTMDKSRLGDYGTKTAAAVTVIQKEFGLPQTGEIDDKTAALIMSKASEKISKQESDNKVSQAKISAAKKALG